MRALVRSLIAIVLTTVVFGFVYPLVMTGFAQVAFKNKANGSLITRNGIVVGSKLAAQELHGAEVLPRSARPRRRPPTTPARRPSRTSARRIPTWRRTSRSRRRRS